MPFPHNFGREESDKAALLEGLPESTELIYTVVPWRTFDVAYEVDRVDRKVWVVVYSARYPRNFDEALQGLQRCLQEAMQPNSIARSAFVHDFKRPEFYGCVVAGGIRPLLQMPRCRSCFDCVAYLDTGLNVPYGVNCDACGNDGGDGTPGQRDEDGNYTLKMTTDGKKQEKQVEKYIRRFTDPSRKCNTCSKPEGVMHVQRCGRCRVVFYCSQACQSKDWPTHKSSCCRPS